MIRLMVGNKGAGKTKALVRMANEAAKTTSGNVVCVEKGLKLTYDLDHQVRLIDTESYAINGFDELYGFLTGIMAGNYDITEVYIDATLKIGGRDIQAFSKMIEKMDSNLNPDEVNVTFSVSCDLSELPESIQKYTIEF